MPPLTVLHVRLAPWYLARVMGIDQPDVKATRFEHFEQGYPIAPSRLHHDGLNLILSQPLGEGIDPFDDCRTLRNIGTIMQDGRGRS